MPGLKKPVAREEGKKRKSIQSKHSTLIWTWLLLSGIILNGCAVAPVKDTTFKYKTFVERRVFKAREKPVGLTEELDVVLMNNGYVPIGNVEVKHRTDRTYKTDTTSKARAVAAEKGGDLLKLTLDRERRDEITKKRGECLQTRRQTSREWQPYEARDEWQTVDACVSWDYITLKTPIIVSQGSVWRYDPDFLNKWADKILIDSIQDGEASLVATLLQSSSVNVNVRDQYGWTPLMFAVNYQGAKSVEMARLLIEKGAKVNLKDHNGRTALMRALFSGNLQSAKLLLQNGADINAEDNFGKKVLDFATDDVRAELQNWLESQKN